MPSATPARVLTPSQVKQYLKARGMAPLSDVINRFDAPSDAVLAILEFWQRRDRVRRILAEPAASCQSGGCGSGQCGSSTEACQTSGQTNSQTNGQTSNAHNDLYAWQEPQSAPVGLDALVDFSQSWQPSISRASSR